MKFSPEIQKFAKFPERRREMEHGVMGDPFVATAEKGERLFGVLLDRLVALCREYHAEDPPATASSAPTARSAAPVAARFPGRVHGEEASSSPTTIPAFTLHPGA